MLEIMFGISMIVTPTLTYFLAKKSVRNGIIAAYEDIMGDLTSEESIEELRTVANSVMKSVTGSVNQALPKLDFKTLGMMLLLGLFKDKFPFIGQMLQPQQQVIPPQQLPPQMQIDPSRTRRQ